MGLQAGLTIVFTIFGGGFRSLVNLFSVANWLFYLLTGEPYTLSSPSTTEPDLPSFLVMGLLILRVKEPYLERPYKTWLITPVIVRCLPLDLDFSPVDPTEADVSLFSLDLSNLSSAL